MSNVFDQACAGSRSPSTAQACTTLPPRCVTLPSSMARAAEPTHVAGLLAELAPGHRPELLTVLGLALGDGPDALIAVLEVGPAGVAEEHLQPVGGLAEEEDARRSREPRVGPSATVGRPGAGSRPSVASSRSASASGAAPGAASAAAAGTGRPASRPLGRAPCPSVRRLRRGLGRRVLVLDLADGRRGRGIEGRPARASVSGHEAQQEDDGLAAEEQQDEREDEQRAADEGVPAPGHGQGCEDQEERQQADLDPEAAQARPSFGVERLTLVDRRFRRARSWLSAPRDAGRVDGGPRARHPSYDARRLRGCAARPRSETGATTPGAALRATPAAWDRWPRRHRPVALGRPPSPREHARQGTRSGGTSDAL